MNIESRKVQTAEDQIRQALNTTSLPEIGLVLGTGLGDWVSSLHCSAALEYADIEGFPRSTVSTHSGRLLLADIQSRPVLILQGRHHLYEGYSPSEVSFGIRVLAQLGVRTLILTNAAGALNPLFSQGSLMVISDHLNMTGHNPLIGPNIDQWGPRFPDMSQVYDSGLQDKAVQTGISLGLRLERGVYVGVLGPSLETPAETRAMRRLGGDAIGMSTVMEAIAARHQGIRLLGLSCLTNLNLPDCMQETSFERIVAQAELSSQNLAELLSTLVPEL